MKRRDPWHGANAPPTAVAVPALSGQDADRTHSRVLTWFAGRWRNHQPKRAEKPHSKSSGRKALDGPAARPNDSACRGEQRREAGSPVRARLMPVRERERGALPSPVLPPSGRKVWRGHSVFTFGMGAPAGFGRHPVKSPTLFAPSQDRQRPLNRLALMRAVLVRLWLCQCLSGGDHRLFSVAFIGNGTSSRSLAASHQA